MKFDELDLKIFNVFLSDDVDGLTTSYLAKKIFNTQNRNELIKKTTQIDYRLKKWHKNGILIYENKNNAKHYFFNKNTITLGESILSVNGKKIEMGEALLIELADKSYIIRFLDEE